LPSLPGAFFFPNVLSPSESDELFQKCRETLLPAASKDGYISGRQGPAVCALLDRDGYPQFYKDLIAKYEQQGLIPIRPFQISTNFYKAGDMMIPHKDGFGHLACITTLVSSLILDFHKKEAIGPITRTLIYFKKEEGDSTALESHEILPTPEASVLMEPGSVLLLTGDSFIGLIRLWDKKWMLYHHIHVTFIY